ncbi:tRNA-modifying protein YgfZ [Vibrio sp.]|nr:tRNA-modifying protein YgfZ [Vibrio sp.]
MTTKIISIGESEPTLMLTSLTNWSAIQISGDDRKSYLQGQVTCDVVTLSKYESTLGAHCDAKGKVWNAFRLFHTAQGYSMIQPKSAADIALKEIRKYAIFSKVSFELSNDSLIGCMGHGASAFIQTLLDEPEKELFNEAQVMPIKGGYAVKISNEQWLLQLSSSDAESLLSENEDNQVDPSVWLKHDIEAGRPILEADQQNIHIPQALNLNLLGGISFSKGCYTGQETVARAKYRGTNKRNLFTLKGFCSSTIEDNELERQVGDNWRSAGHCLSYYQDNQGNVIASAVLPNNLDITTAFRLKSQPEHQWNILPHPYSLEEKE